jgi:UDP-N-acetylglucosamine--N-acetylmuramyl-(pentapeptide) pyrophosphoryl-undecaprenol N-acetylglucosamine transferase
MEQRLVERAGISFRGISSGQLRVANPLKILGSLGKMSSGLQQSLAIIDSFRPDVCFVTGGYVCGPVAVACSLRKVPILIYLPDVTPGYAIRWLSKLAQRVAVTLPEVARHFGGAAPVGKAVVTGYPVRGELIEAAQDRGLARRKLREALGWQAGGAGADDGLPLVLIWGGSQGARAINRAAWRAAEQITQQAEVLHVVGERDWPLYEEWAQTRSVAGGAQGAEQQARYHAVPYLHEEMALALAAADLTVARAGASALGEFPAAGLPAILAPYSGVNQMDNAQALERRGAAVIVVDEELEARLGATVVELLSDAQRLQVMREEMKNLARPYAAQHIADEIKRLAVHEA